MERSITLAIFKHSDEGIIVDFYSIKIFDNVLMIESLVGIIFSDSMFDVIGFDTGGPVWHQLMYLLLKYNSKSIFTVA